jgi:hypothetical protein
VPLGLLPMGTIDFTDYYRALISPANGRVYYYLNPELRIFEPEDVGSPENGRPGSFMVEKNDPVVETPPCGAVGIRVFILDYEGVPAYQCSGEDPLWYREGEPLPPCPFFGFPMRIGANGAILCSQSVIDPQGTVHEFSEPVDAFVYRVKPDGGFWGIVERDGEYERWRIDDDGRATFEGVYTAPPEGWNRINADVPGWALQRSLKLIGVCSRKLIG